MYTTALGRTLIKRGRQLGPIVFCYEEFPLDSCSLHACNSVLIDGMPTLNVELTSSVVPPSTLDSVI